MKETSAKQASGVVAAESVPLSELLKKAKHDPCGFFDQYPINEVRKVCLDTLTEGPADDNRPDYCDRDKWAEEHIIAYLKAHQSDVWEPLLRWYLFGAKDKDTVARAINFAISTAQQNPYCLFSISKQVIGKLRQFDQEQFYWLSSVRPFLVILLSQILPGKYSIEYGRSDWYCTERAIRLIVEVKDVTFLPQVEELASLHARRVVKEREHDAESDPFCVGQHLNLLEQAVAKLKEAKATQFAGLSSTLGTHLRGRANLTGDVTVHLQCPEQLFAEKQFFSEEDRLKKTAATLRFELSDPSEKGQLLQALSKMSVTYWTDGFARVQSPDEKRETSVFNQNVVLNDNLSCNFTLLLNTGLNRFWWSFREGKDFRSREVAKVAKYITLKLPEPRPEDVLDQSGIALD